MWHLLAVAALTTLTIVGCSSTNTPPSTSEPKTSIPAVSSRPDKDGTPLYRPGMDQIPDAVPRFEPVTAAGNKSPYSVLGRTYQVSPKPYGFRQRGIGSWYGTKFHGEKTSNGEPYDVYAMTAAHKTLPIPCYVRVRNLDNGRSVVVRVNDRGPFHDGRIIDLSYAAAWKLGYANHGTANVELELLDPGAHEWAAADNGPSPVQGLTEDDPTVSSSMWVQAGAFRNIDGARRLQQNLVAMTGMQSTIVASGTGDQTIHRVRIGPMQDPQHAFDAQRKIADANLGKASIVTE